MNRTFYTGSYADGHGRGIYRFSLDGASGSLSTAELALDLPQAKHLSRTDGYLAAAYCRDGVGGVCLMRHAQGQLQIVTEQPQGRVAPCYTTFFGDRLVTANFHEGTVCIYHHMEGRLGTEKRLELGRGTGCHQVIQGKRLMLVPCLARDRIRLFDPRQDCAPVGDLVFPKGSGPRHGVFNEARDRLWVVGECDNRLYHYRVTPNGGYLAQEPIEILPPDMAEKGALSAAIRLSPDGRFLIVSTRGAELLTTWEITGDTLCPVQQTSCGGKHPRDILLTPDGRFLLVANRDTDEVVCFARDVESGRIGTLTGRTTIPEAVALLCWKENGI